MSDVAQWLARSAVEVRVRENPWFISQETSLMGKRSYPGERRLRPIPASRLARVKKQEFGDVPMHLGAVEAHYRLPAVQRFGISPMQFVAAVAP